MNLSPQQLEELGRQVIGKEKVDKAKEYKDQGLEYYEYYKKAEGIMEGAVPKISRGLNRQTGIAIAQTFTRPLTPSISKMPLGARARAELVKTSSVLQKKGLDEAIKRMRENSPNFEFIPQLSTADYIVARNKITNKIELAFRGTDPTAKITTGIGKGMPEPVMWTQILATGNEGKFYDQHNLEAILQKLKQGGIEASDIGHISGYSMGATKAHRLADMIGTDTTLLNPFVGKNFFKKPIHPEVIHNVYRTTEDIASAQGFLRNKLPPNVKVDSIDPIAVLSEQTRGIKGALEDVVALHDLDHFVEEGNRRSDIREASEKIDARVKQFEGEAQGITAEQRKALQEEMILELEPEMKVVAGQAKKFKARTGVMKGVITSGRILGSAGAGAVASMATDEALKEIGVDNPFIKAGVSGVAAGYAAEKGLRALGGASSLLNLRAAVLSGGAAALTQETSSRLLNAALLEFGVDRDTAGIISESTGGLIGTSTTFAVPVAINRALGLTAQSATRLATVAAPEAEGLLAAEAAAEAAADVAAEAAAEAAADTGVEIALEVAAETAAEVAAEAGGEGMAAAAATAAIPIPGFRFIAGAILAGTVIAGALRASQAAHSPHIDYVLRPTRNQDVDNKVKNDETIQRLIRDFNDRADFSQEAIRHLEAHITDRTINMPNIPKDYGYNGSLMPVEKNYARNKGVIYEYDYSKIPESIRNMNAMDYRKAIGDAKLYQNYPMEFYHLTNSQKEHITNEILQKNPDLYDELWYDENQTINYRLAKALEADTQNTTYAERHSIIDPIIIEHRQQEQKRRAIEEGIAKFRTETKVMSLSHQLYSQFIQNSPEVAEFLDNGDIDGLNEYLARSVYDPNVSQKMFTDLTTATTDTNIINEIMTSNVPQFNALGQVLYIKAGDQPVRISQNVQDRNIREAQSIHRMGKYTKITSELEKTELGQHLLERSPVGQLLNKGGTPQEINIEIDKFYKTHPHFAAKVNRGLLAIPKIEADGSVVYKQKDVLQITPEEHTDRRKQIHSLTIEDESTPTQVEQPSTQSVESQ